MNSDLRIKLQGVSLRAGIAALISVMLHGLILFLILVQTRGAGSGHLLHGERVSDRVNIEISAENQVADSGQKSVLSKDEGTGLYGGNYYYASHEVDKRSELVLSAPVSGLVMKEGKVSKGRIKVRVLINELGDVDAVTVLELEPGDKYKRNFLDAIWRSKFSPAELKGLRVKSRKVLAVEFEASY